LESLIYLSEREIGYDAVAIGFPSVQGCRAIVLVTAAGLFGYHLNGTLTPKKLEAFESFVTVRASVTNDCQLYAASSGPGLLPDHVELRSIAIALHYTGPIYWVDLPGPGSSYVHFQNIYPSAPVITSRAWREDQDNVSANKMTYPPSLDRKMANGAPPPVVYNNLSPYGLVVSYPEPALI
jgi:hypothetical protein